MGLEAVSHGGELWFGGFSFCSVSGFTKETWPSVVGSSPDASLTCVSSLRCVLAGDLRT